MSAALVIAEVKRAFVFSAGYSEHASVCCVTPASLRAISKRIPGFLHDAVPLLDVRLASHSKLGADFVLRRALGKFMDHTSVGRRIVLLTGDADFLEPVQRALDIGIDVQLVHFESSSSRLLVGQRYASPPVEWMRFLTDLNGGATPDMPYDDGNGQGNAKATMRVTEKSVSKRTTKTPAKRATCATCATCVTEKPAKALEFANVMRESRDSRDKATTIVAVTSLASLASLTSRLLDPKGWARYVGALALQEIRRTKTCGEREMIQKGGTRHQK